MAMQTFEYVCGEGSFTVRLILHDTGRGIVGVLIGGDSPHVGSVVLAVPRSSLANADSISCDLYTVPVPGHLDYVVAQDMARVLCVACGQPVSITAGIHVDGATQAEIARISELCRQLTWQAARALGDENA